MNKLIRIFLICLMGGFIQCCSSGQDRPSDDEIIISILKYSNPYAGMNDICSLVLPDTSFNSDLLDSTDEEIEQIADRLQGITKNQKCDFEDLLMDLIERNRKSVRLTVKSDPSKGIIIDYEGKFKHGTSSNWKQWRNWTEENPNVMSVHSISLPAYDPDSKIVLIYAENDNGPLAASGGLIVYKYENGKVTHLGGFAMWIS